MGAGNGDTVTYTAPSGVEIKVTIVKFEAYGG
jgi:transcription elongation factor GreA